MITRWLTHIDKWLEGQPDALLTGILIGYALLALYVAWRGKPHQKAFLAVWFGAP